MKNIKIKAAAVHAAPIYMNKKTTLDKVVNIISQAAEESITLLAFPEYFINTCSPLKQAGAIAEYARQSVVALEDLKGVTAACRKFKITVSLGISERVKDGYSLFNSIVTIDSDGTILGVHRKLQPTFAERYVWSQGSGHTLRTYETKAGYKLGGLACWENTFNGARQALIEQGQHIHVGAWPALDIMAGFQGVANSQIEALMKNHALTAQVFVLSAANYVDESCLKWIEENIGPQDLIKEGGGWTAIIHPFCTIIAGPHGRSEEKLVTAEINLDELGPVKAWIDGSGHYKRPEVLSSKVDMTPHWPDDRAVAGPIPFED